MNALFHPITQQAAVAELAALPARIEALTHITKRGHEGHCLREQARQHLRWYQLFLTLNRRALP